MSATLESALQQALVDSKKAVGLDGETYPVRQTAKSKLKQIDFGSKIGGCAPWNKIRTLNLGGRS
jgi:hypothetical protein